MKRSPPFNIVDTADVAFLDLLPIEMWCLVAPHIRPYKTWYSFVRSCKSLWRQCGGFENVKRCFPGTLKEHEILLSEFMPLKGLDELFLGKYSLARKCFFKACFANSPSVPILAGGYVRRLVLDHLQTEGHDWVDHRLRRETISRKSMDLDCFFSVPDFFTRIPNSSNYQWCSAKQTHECFMFMGKTKNQRFDRWCKSVQEYVNFFPQVTQGPVDSTIHGPFHGDMDFVLVDRSFERDGSPILGFDITPCQFALAPHWYDGNIDIVTTPLAMYSLQTGWLDFVGNQYTEQEIIDMMSHVKEWLDGNRDVDEDSVEGRELQYDLRYLQRLHKYFIDYGYRHPTLLAQLEETSQEIFGMRVLLGKKKYARQVSKLGWREIVPPPFFPSESISSANEEVDEANSISDEDGLY